MKEETIKLLENIEMLAPKMSEEDALLITKNGEDFHILYGLKKEFTNN